MMYELSKQKQYLTEEPLEDQEWNNMSQAGLIPRSDEMIYRASFWQL